MASHQHSRHLLAGTAGAFIHEHEQQRFLTQRYITDSCVISSYGVFNVLHRGRREGKIKGRLLAPMPERFVSWVSDCDAFCFYILEHIANIIFKFSMRESCLWVTVTSGIRQGEARFERTMPAGFGIAHDANDLTSSTHRRELNGKANN